MKLIVGLGNPGKNYENTRHNVGFLCVDNYLKDGIWREKFDALYIENKIGGERVIFIKPLTYMNYSGLSVKKFVDYYKIEYRNVLVIQDDLDLPLGKIRIKKNSSDGGHNGIKSIINELGSNEFFRLKVGISKSEHIDTKDYVLGRFSSEEKNIIDKSVEVTKNIIDDYITNSIDDTIKTYNIK